MGSLKERLGALLQLGDKKEKFDALVKIALKNHNFSIISQISETLYEIASGTASFTADIKDIKREYDAAAEEEELERISEKLAQTFITESKMISFTNAQTLLRFLCMRDDEVRRNYVSADFIEGLKKVVIYTPDDITLHILDESCLKKWGVPREVLFSVADRNMCRLLEKAQTTESSLNKSVRALELALPNKELCVSLMMCNDFAKTVHKILGPKFLAVAPSRESILVLENVTNDILEGLGAVIIEEYRSAAHPLTTDVLLFTPQGIEAVGRFSVNNVLKN